MLSFERRFILNSVEKRVEALQQGYRQNIGLIAPSGTGKSHLLLQIHRTYADHPTLITVALRIDFLNLEHFADIWLGSILTAFLRHQRIAAEGTLSRLQEQTAVLLPRTSEKITQIKKMLRKSESHLLILRELFSVPAVLAQETSKKVLIILDEFHLLAQLPVSDPFAVLGKEIMVGKDVLYLAASSMPETSQEIFRNKLSLLFGNFEILELKALTFSEFNEFLTERAKHFKFSAVQKKFLYRLTDGVPLYLEFLMDSLAACFPYSGDRGLPAEGLEVAAERLLLAVHRELCEQHGKLSLLFEKKLQNCRRLAKNHNLYIHTLIALSDGRRKISAIASFVGCKQGEAKKILERLVDEEIVVRRGAFYLIADSLFNFWMREVFKRRQNLYQSLDNSLREVFLARLQGIYEEEAADKTAEDLTRPLEMLLKEFRNDLVEILGQRVRLPHFTEITTRPFSGRFYPMIAKGKNIKWLCLLAAERVTEEDVLAFHGDSKKIRKKKAKKVLIALDGIEQNAKLLAQEIKIQIWNKEILNDLLVLHNLPKLIFTKEMHGETLGALAQSVSAAE